MESFEPILINRTITLELAGGNKLTKNETFLTNWTENTLLGNFSHSGGICSGFAEFIPFLKQLNNSGFEFNQSSFYNPDFILNSQLNPGCACGSYDKPIANLNGEPLVGYFPESSPEIQSDIDTLTNHNKFPAITDNLPPLPGIVAPPEIQISPNVITPPRAAGNGNASSDNVNYDGYANSRYTIAVAAIDHNGRQSRYSEPGASTLVSAFSSGAPGAGITTTDLLGSSGLNGLPNQDYTNGFGGTSSATPLVSGVVALMLEANPNLTWRDVQHILVKTSRQTDPFDADWVINGGGNWVNHKYGFGSIDATAAVNAAQSWTTVASEISTTSNTIATSLSIPDNNPTGVTSTATISDDIKIEWAEVVFDADHTARGDLEVILTSPNGTESVLAEQRFDFGDNYDNWVFTSARHWDESSAGNWTLKVTDKATGNTGTLNSWKLNLYGTPKDAVTTTQIDLSGQFFDVTPEPLNAGDSFQVNYQIQNRGSGNADRFLVDFYLSTDSVISTTDTKLGSAEVSGVAGNSSTEVMQQNLRLPGVWDGADFWRAIEDGTYHIGMIVDSANSIRESNEANNRNTGDLKDFDRVQINNTLPVVNISLPEIFEFRPFHTRGDTDFDGNGPRVVTQTNLTSTGSFLNLSTNATFTETRSDWTTFNGSTSRSVNVGALYSGWTIDSILSQPSDSFNYTDSNYARDVFVRGSGDLVRRYEFQGDRNGGVFGGPDDPWVSIAFNPARVKLRRS